MNLNHKKVSLFVIGASKCGTTSFYHVLKQHPDICMSKKKETNYFALPQSKQNKINYDSYFNYCYKKMILGEVSPIYSELSIVPWVPKEICNYNPKAKIIYLIRNPLERLKSVWKQTLHSGHWYKQKYKTTINLSVPKMRLNLEHAIFNYPPFLDSCKYWQILNSYRKFFPDQQIKVVFFEDLIKKPYLIYNDFFEFLNLKKINIENLKLHHNLSRGKLMLNPSSKLLFLAKIQKIVSFFPNSKIKEWYFDEIFQPIPQEVIIDNSLQRRIIDQLKDDIKKIYLYTNRNNFWQL